VGTFMLGSNPRESPMLRALRERTQGDA